MKRLRHLALGIFLTVAAGAVATAQDFDQVVLIEDFSSVTCVNCPAAAAIVHKIVKENPQRVISLQYHLDIPGRNDPFYAMNKPDQDARESYYGGFNGLPQVFVNGIFTSGTNEADVRAETNAQLSSGAPVEVKVTQSRESGSIKANVSVTGDLPNGNRLYVAAVEKYVFRPETYFRDEARSAPYVGETEFHDLFRSFVTPSGGVELNVSPGNPQSFDYTIPIGEDWDADQMFVLAWVQDEFTNDAVQAGFSNPTASVRDFSEVTGYELLGLSPNPTDGATTLSFRLPQPEQVTITLVDALGREVATVDHGLVASGDHTLPIDFATLPNGFYRVVLRAGDQMATEDLVRIGN